VSTSTEIAKARAKAAKWETATPHLVSELVTYIEKLIEEIEHGHHDQEVTQGAAAQEAWRAAGSTDTGGEAGEGAAVVIAVPAKAG
jgi:hypothetical protein